MYTEKRLNYKVHYYQLKNFEAVKYIVKNIKY